MARQPDDIHWTEQMQARASDIANIVGSYHAGLIRAGAPQIVAWDMAGELERRLWRTRIFKPDNAYQLLQLLLEELEDDDDE